MSLPLRLRPVYSFALRTFSCAVQGKTPALDRMRCPHDLKVLFLQGFAPSPLYGRKYRLCSLRSFYILETNAQTTLASTSSSH
jgi:hypothetical protein